jgi:hypothetical protein
MSVASEFLKNGGYGHSNSMKEGKIKCKWRDQTKRTVQKVDEQNKKKKSDKN